MTTIIRPQSDDPAAIRQTLTLAFDQIETTEPYHYPGQTGQPAFQNSWVNFDATFPSRAASYFKDILGIVHLNGVVKSGTVNTVIFTLPGGYRPPYDRTFAVSSGAGFGTIDVQADGDVQESAGGNAYLFLDGIHYRAIP